MVFVNPIYQSCWGVMDADIKANCKIKFEQGNYADSVETAFKLIEQKIRKVLRDKGIDTSQYTSPVNLIHFAFSANGNPPIRLASQTDDSYASTQKGYMELYAGAFSAIRNPKSHQVIIIEKDKALNFLFVANLLIKKIDERI